MELLNALFNHSMSLVIDTKGDQEIGLKYSWAMSALFPRILSSGFVFSICNVLLQVWCAPCVSALRHRTAGLPFFQILVRAMYGCWEDKRSALTLPSIGYWVSVALTYDLRDCRVKKNISIYHVSTIGTEDHMKNLFILSSFRSVLHTDQITVKIRKWLSHP